MLAPPRPGEVPYRVALSRVPRLGWNALAALLDAFGDAEAAWNASPERIAHAHGVGPALADAIARARVHSHPQRLMEEASRAGCEVVVLGQPEYPTRLAAISGAPSVLYARGNLGLLADDAVAVVGTRRASDYGLRCADAFGSALARAGVVVISGMARGVDEAAHRAALQAGGKTIAVLGCGADVCYPPESRALKAAIEASGLVLSQFPPGAQPLAQQFPARNRAISGLSQGVVVVEAGERSGALITAECAIDQERPVFAVPGSIFRSVSQGCHRLLNEGTAVLAGTPEDVLVELGLRSVARRVVAPAAPQPDDALDAEERAVWGALQRGADPLDADEAVEAEEIMRRSGMASQTVFRILMRLELEGLVIRSAGNRYRRASRK